MNRMVNWFNNMVSSILDFFATQIYSCSSCVYKWIRSFFLEGWLEKEKNKELRAKDLYAEYKDDLYLAAESDAQQKIKNLEFEIREWNCKKRMKHKVRRK